MAKGYALTWVACSNGDNFFQGTEFSQDVIDPVLYAELRRRIQNMEEIPELVFLEEFNNDVEDKEVRAAATFMCMTIKADDDTAPTALPTTAALTSELWKQNFFLVEGELGGVLPSPVCNGILSMPQESHDTFDDMRHRMFQGLYQRVAERCGAETARNVEAFFSDNGFEDQVGFRILMKKVRVHSKKGNKKKRRLN